MKTLLNIEFICFYNPISYKILEFMFRLCGGEYHRIYILQATKKACSGYRSTALCTFIIFSQCKSLFYLFNVSK